MTRAAGMAAALLLALVPVARGPAARAQGAQATVRLASQTAWVTPGEPFDLRLQVAGVPEPDRVVLRVSVRARVTSRSQFRLTTTGRGLGQPVLTTSSRLSALLPTDAAGAILVRLGPPGLQLTRTGVYPVEVVLQDRAGPVLDRFVTHLVFVSPSDAVPLRVALVVPVHAPTGRGYRSVQGLSVLADTLASPSLAQVPFTLAPTPETLDALARSGREADTAVLDAVRAAAAGRTVLARPYVPVDAAALVADGLGGQLAAELRTGVAVATGVLGGRPETRTWLADTPLDDTALERLRDLLVDRVVVPDRTLAPVDLQLTLAQPFVLETKRGARVTAVLADDGLAAHFRSSGDRVLAAHQLLADLATIWMDAPRRPRGVAVVVPRTWAPSRAFLDAAFAGLAASPVLRPVPLGELFDELRPATTATGRPLVRRLAPLRERGRSTGFAAAFTRAERSVAAARSMLPAASPLAEEFARRLLAAASADLAPREARAALDRIVTDVRALGGRVIPPARRTVTLTAREGEIPLTFANTGPDALRVLVRLRSDKLTFPDGTLLALELPPRNHTVRIAVQARAAGLSPLTVEVVSPDGGLVIGTTRLEVRSTAASGVGVALSVGAGVFLALWWARHVARGRRARRLLPAT